MKRESHLNHHGTVVAVDVANQRVLIVGDSLSHPGADTAPTIQDITHGFDRTSSAPGDLLGSILLEQGAAAVRIDAKVGRSAMSFFSSEPAADLIAADQAFQPSRVVVMLGTNDSLRDPTSTQTAMTALRDAYRNTGAEVWAIGPMTYVGKNDGLNAPAARVFDVMQHVFGKTRVIDARPLSTIAARAADGIHFTAAGAKQLAPQLAQALLSARGTSSLSIVAGFTGGALLGACVWLLRRRRRMAASKP